MTDLMGRGPLGQKGQSKPKKASKPMRKVSDRKAKESHPLRRSAKGEACTLRIPGVCKNDTSAVVLCHVNGVLLKSNNSKQVDMHAFYGCSACHDAQEYQSNWAKHGITWRDIIRAVFETQKKMVAKGLIFVKE